MATSEIPHAAHLYPGNLVLLAHWEDARAGQEVPARDHINLKHIAEYLPWIAIVEPMVERQSYRCRLAGSGLTEMWGCDMTGADLREPCGMFERDMLARLFDGALIRQEAFSARLRLLPAGEEPMVAEMLGLPVRASHGAVQLMVSVLPYSCRRRTPPKGLRNIHIAGTRRLADLAEGLAAMRALRKFKLIAGGVQAT